jgi:hypothetical protein
MPALDRAARRDARRSNESRRNAHLKSARRRQLRRSGVMRLQASYGRAA